MKDGNCFQFYLPMTITSRVIVDTYIINQSKKCHVLIEWPYENTRKTCDLIYDVSNRVICNICYTTDIRALHSVVNVSLQSFNHKNNCYNHFIKP